MKPDSVKAVLEEPYRLLFPVGILMGMIGVGHWLAYAAGWTPSCSAFYHSSVQMQAYMSCFVFGFLLTAMPRFASVPHATLPELSVFTGLILAIPAFLGWGIWQVSEVCFIALLLFFARFAVKRIISRKGSNGGRPPLEFIWIPIAVTHGVTGMGLLIAGQSKALPIWAYSVGKPMEEQGFLLAIVLGIGGFLAPRLMGRYEAAKSAGSEAGKIVFHVAAGLILFASFWLEGLGLKPAAYWLRALLVTTVLVWNRTLPFPPRVPDLFVKLVWVSFWMVAIGHWGIAVFPQFRTALLHLVLISGFSLMTFAVGTMVTLSHAGEAEKLRQPLLIFKIIGLGMAVTALARVSAVFFPGNYFPILGFAAAVWLSAGIAWLCFVTPKIVKIPAADEFEKMHQAAKQRIQNLEAGTTECCSHQEEKPKCCSNH